MSAHHKSKEALAHRNALLQWYYSIYPLFGYCCVGTECFYILLYVHHFFPNPIVYQVYACLMFSLYVVLNESITSQLYDRGISCAFVTFTLQYPRLFRGR